MRELLLPVLFASCSSSQVVVVVTASAENMTIFAFDTQCTCIAPTLSVDECQTNSHGVDGCSCPPTELPLTQLVSATGTEQLDPGTYDGDFGGDRLLISSAAIDILANLPPAPRIESLQPLTWTVSEPSQTSVDVNHQITRFSCRFPPGVTGVDNPISPKESLIEVNSEFEERFTIPDGDVIVRRVTTTQLIGEDYH